MKSLRVTLLDEADHQYSSGANYALSEITLSRDMKLMEGYLIAGLARDLPIILRSYMIVKGIYEPPISPY